MHLDCCLVTLAFLSDVVFLYKLYQVHFGLFHYFLKPLTSSFTQNKACLCLGFPAGFHNLSAYASQVIVSDDLDMLVSNCHTEPQTLLNINNWLQRVSNSTLLSMQSQPYYQHNKNYIFFLPLDYRVEDGLWTICDVSTSSSKMLNFQHNYSLIQLTWASFMPVSLRTHKPGKVCTYFI